MTTNAECVHVLLDGKCGEVVEVWHRFCQQTHTSSTMQTAAASLKEELHRRRVGDRKLHAVENQFTELQLQKKMVSVGNRIGVGGL